MQHATQLIQAISERGITIVLIEHLMRVVLGLSTRLLVLHEGRLIADGNPVEVVRDARVILLQILQTNLEMQFSGTSDNMLTGFLNDTLHHRIGFRQTFKTCRIGLIKSYTQKQDIK